jgi:hypothetical protein
VHPYLRLELAIESVGAATEADRPAFAAALLRRVLGKALIDRFCPFGRPLCEARPPAGVRPSAPRELCDLAEACPYGVLFAASWTARPPYALHVPSAGERGYRVEITLYGPAWRLYPWALASPRRRCGEALGRPGSPGRCVRCVAPCRTDGANGSPAASSRSCPPSCIRTSSGSGWSPSWHRSRSPWSFSRRPGAAAAGLRAGALWPARRAHPRPLRGLYGEGASEILRPELRGAIEAEAARVPVLAEATRGWR